jgi:hypothetical protein
MIPKLQITVQHIDGIAGTYPVTPWIIDQFEQMSKTSFMRTFSGIENADVGHLFLLAFLAERQAGGTVAAWREAYVKTLDTIPSVEVIEDPKDPDAAESSEDSSLS